MNVLAPPNETTTQRTPNLTGDRAPTAATTTGPPRDGQERDRAIVAHGPWPFLIWTREPASLDARAQRTGTRQAWPTGKVPVSDPDPVPCMTRRSRPEHFLPRPLSPWALATPRHCPRGITPEARQPVMWPKCPTSPRLHSRPRNHRPNGPGEDR